MTFAPQATTVEAPKGVPDYLPPQSYEINAVKDVFVRAAERAGYQPVELPIFEHTELFVRGVGTSTDIVGKEMYTFLDRGDRSITLRPEGTAGVMRAVIEHHLDRGPVPIKLVYDGPVFRYERPQSGRLRQFQTVGVEAIGIDDPILDVETIAIAVEALQELEIQQSELHINFLGGLQSRPAYREALLSFLLTCDLDQQTRERARANPLRVLDDKRPEVQEMVANAPLLRDFLTPSEHEHFAQVVAGLEAAGIAFVDNPRLVRGLDYYTKTAFEFVHPLLGAQSGIGGGGRYDGLMEELGGKNLSGVGFGMGIERVMLAREKENITHQLQRYLDVVIIRLSADVAPHTVTLTQEIRQQGLKVDQAWTTTNMKNALKTAARSGAVCAVIIGDDEIANNTVVIRDMTQKKQLTLSRDNYLEHLIAMCR